MRPDGAQLTGIVLRSRITTIHAQQASNFRRLHRFSTKARHGQQGQTVQAGSTKGSNVAASSSSSNNNNSGIGSHAASNGNSSGSASSVNTSSSSSTTSSSTGKGPASLSRRRNTDLALIVTGTLGLSALLFYNLRTQSKESTPSTLSSLSPSSKSFTLPVQTQSGLQLRTIQMLSPTKVNEILTQNERTYTVTRPGNPLYRYETNSIASNPTCEDAQAFTILEHEGKDYVLASVFDGHAGFWTSRLMSENLEKYIARELFEVLRGGYKALSVSQDSWWNWLWQAGTHRPKIPSTPATTEKTSPSAEGVSDASNQAGTEYQVSLLSQALRAAYQLADRDLIQPPMDYLKTLEARSTSRPLQLTDEQRQYGLNLLQPALSGSCSISALLDTSASRLYVATAGDSRAVMGTFDSSTGKWRAEILSEDQTGRSIKEVERMKREHPKSEEETVIMRGRVLGGLEPTRAFGDGKYKFPIGMQEKLIAAFRPSTTRTAPPSLYKTPPYVTADPVVTSFDLSSHLDHTSQNATLETSGVYSPIASQPNKDLQGGDVASSKRFIVLATDGLYDCLSSEEVVALVAGHLDGLKGDRTKSEVLALLEPSVTSQSTLASPHKPREDKDKGKRFCFEDTNLCTHLVRNALGGAQREHVSALLAIPPPYSRRYRDDITMTVLLLGDGEHGTGLADKSQERLLPGVRRLYNQPARAKL